MQESMNKVLLTAVAIAVIILSSYLLFKNPPVQPTPSPTPTITVGVTPSASPSSEGTNHTITFTDAGYAPKSITVKVGDTVTFNNESSKNVWTASASHPSHTVYDGTSLQQHCPDPDNNSFDQCAPGGPGSFWSFTFTKAGTWNYHDHLNAQNFGTIIVQ